MMKLEQFSKKNDGGLIKLFLLLKERNLGKLVLLTFVLFSSSLLEFASVVLLLPYLDFMVNSTAWYEFIEKLTICYQSMLHWNYRYVLTLAIITCFCQERLTCFLLIFKIQADQFNNSGCDGRYLL